MSIPKIRYILLILILTFRAFDMLAQNDTQRNVINTLITANPAIFEKTLDEVDSRYGSLRNYLSECIGVTPGMMDTLRERYLQ